MSRAINNWVFYKDLFAYMVAGLKGENYVGRDISILTKLQLKYSFEGGEICGGCTHGLPNIYIFMHGERLSNPEDATVDIIIHECLHQVLFLQIGGSIFNVNRRHAFDSLDNIHFLGWESCSNKLLEIHAKFAEKKNWRKSKYEKGL